MKSLQISRYGLKLAISTQPIPQITSSQQVLVKMKYAPINPSDVFYVKGIYGIRKPLPTVGGFEGCGEVVQSEDKKLIGKQVMCWAEDSLNYGTWNGYFLCLQKNLIEIQEQSQKEQLSLYSSPFINPMTAVGFHEIAKESKAKGVVLNAGSSAVSIMSIKLMKQSNISTILIVRKQEQVKKLLDIGATVVLNSTHPDYQQHLIQSIQAHKAKIFYDALGDDNSGLILKYLQEEGQLIGYGRLSNNKIANIDPIDLVFKQKQVKGFWLSKWLNTISQETIDNKLKPQIQQNITTTFSTKIQSVVQPTNENINELLASSLTSGSQGKIILDLTNW